MTWHRWGELLSPFEVPLLSWAAGGLLGIAFSYCLGFRLLFFLFFGNLWQVLSNFPFQTAPITMLMPLNHCCDEISYFLITFSI